MHSTFEIIELLIILIVFACWYISRNNKKWPGSDPGFFRFPDGLSQQSFNPAGYSSFFPLPISAEPIIVWIPWIPFVTTATARTFTSFWKLKIKTAFICFKIWFFWSVLAILASDKFFVSVRITFLISTFICVFKRYFHKASIRFTWLTGCTHLFIRHLIIFRPSRSVLRVSELASSGTMILSFNQTHRFVFLTSMVFSP